MKLPVRYFLTVCQAGCVRPGRDLLVAVVPGEDCEGTYWRWSLTGLLRFGDVGGGCVTSTSGQGRVSIKPCQSDREDQLVEAGLDVEAGGENKITPVSAQLYQQRTESRRKEELEAAF